MSQKKHIECKKPRISRRNFLRYIGYGAISLPFIGGNPLEFPACSRYKVNENDSYPDKQTEIITAIPTKPPTIAVNPYHVIRIPLVMGNRMQPTIQALKPGAVYEVAGGIYGLEGALTIPAGVTLKAVPGTRPIFVSTTGYAPKVFINTGATVDGLWFGGEVGSDYNVPPQGIITVGGGVTIKNCTIWSSYDCLNEGSGPSPCLYDNNRFINCGGGGNYHTIYITTRREGINTKVSNNIMIGGNGGYHLHFYHDPTNLMVTNNFLGDALYGPIALSGTGHTVTKNIAWSYRESRGTYGILFSGEPTQTVTRNLFYGGDYDPGHPYLPPVTTNNYFAKCPYHFGDLQTIWTETQLESALGIDILDINSTIDSLRHTFLETPENIYDNTYIESWFATIARFRNYWNLYTA